MTPGELLILADNIRQDRVSGTESHWWRDRMELHLEDLGRYDPQDQTDKRRIMRLALLETAFLLMADKYLEAKE